MLRATYGESNAAKGKSRLCTDAYAANFDQAGNRVRRAAIERAIAGPNLHPVVGHQTKAMVEGPQGQVALAGAGRALDEDASPEALVIVRDEPSMKDHRRASGRWTTNRAPSTFPSAPCRFSAPMEPPWAAAIWRAMESPRPEFPPKAAPFGREV